VTLVANAAGIGFALLLNRTSLSFRMMRTLAFLPQVLSGVIVGFVWRYVLAQDGILNELLVHISLITMLKLYDIIVALTSGGPANSTQSTALYIIKLAFTDDRFGYASAVAMLLLVVSAVVALSVTGLLRRREVDL